MDFRSLFIKAYSKIKNAHKVLLIGHINPDGDALSSLGVFLEILENLNINSLAYCAGKKSDIFDYLPHSEKIINDKEAIGSLENFDLIITLDCGSLSRTDLTKEILALKLTKPQTYIIEFDHHPKIDDYADLEIREPQKAATAEIIYNFLKENKIVINKNIANCILTGILTDTGNFLYPITSDENIEIASKMMSLGAQFPKIINNTLRNKNLLTMKLWGMAIDNLRINTKYNIAYSVVTKEDLMTLGSEKDLANYLNSEMFGDIAGFLGNLADVKAVMLLREDGGNIKGSIRTSQPDVDISGLARYLGGGGHPKASGFSVSGHIIKKGNSWEII